jgi:hypothetical protein
MSLGSLVFAVPVILELCAVCEVEVFIVDVCSDYGVLGCDAV